MTSKEPLAIPNSEIKQFVREVRLLSGMTQERFAAKLGVTYTTINRWENGRSKPSPMALKLLEEMLHQMGDRAQGLLAKYSSSEL